MSNQVLRAAAMAAALLPAMLVAAPPLSLDQALDLAVERSQLTRSARAAASSSADMARVASQQPDPMLTAGIDNLPVSGRDRFDPAAEAMTMKRVGIAQEWVSSEKRAVRQAAADAVVHRELAMEGIAAAETRMQTAVAYIDAHYAGETLALAALNEKHAREELEAGKARLATTSGSSPEALALAGVLGAAEDESSDRRQRQAAAATLLQRWTGSPIEGTLPFQLTALPSQEAYVAGHPQVVGKRLDVEVARKEAELARTARRPNWTYELSYGQRQGRPDMVSFGVSIPLPVAPAARQDRETAAKLALVEKAEAELEEARRAAAAEYAVGASDARRLRQRVERFQASVLVPSRQRTAASLAAYRSNQASLAMFFEARRAELEAQQKLLSLQRDLARAEAQLVFTPISQGVAQ